MRKAVLLLSVMLGIAVWLSFPKDTGARGGPPADPAGNLLQNADFEEGAEGVRTPERWTFEQRAARKGRVEVVTAPTHGGRLSVKLLPNQNNRPWEIVNSPLAIGQGFPAEEYKGKTLYLSGWLAAEGATTAVASVYLLRRNGAVTSTRLEQPPGSSGFAYHEDSIFVPNDGGLQYVIFNLTAEGADGAAVFDDLYLGLAKPASGTPSQSVVADSGPALSASVTIHAAREIREIPKTLYGMNIEWIWDGNGIWDSSRKDFNPTIVELTRDLGVSILRFPGGVFSDFYRWRDGIGASSRRPTGEHYRNGPKSVHNFGTDEVLEFADRVGASVLMTANAGTASASEAAEWVRYVNTSKRGSGSAGHVQWWEVGNELYVADPTFVTMPPRQYAEKFLAFARAMRAVDPSIKVGAISDANFGMNQPSYQNWSQQVLEIAGAEMDFLAVHNAYAPVLESDKGWDARTVYAAMLAAPMLIKQHLDALTESIGRIAHDDAGRIRLAVTEWGPFFQLSPDGRFLDHPKTLGSALFVASALKAFIESPRTDLATGFQLVDQLYMGWIGTRGGEFIPKAPYYALQMYTKHFGTVLVESAATGPTYDSPAVGRVPATRGVPYLDIVTSLSADRDTMYIMAINKHFDRDITANIAIDGYSPDRLGTEWTLNGAALDANTGTQLFQTPEARWGKQTAVGSNGRIDLGGPGEVAIRQSALTDMGRSFSYTFPAHSVTALQLTRARAAQSRQ